MSSLWTCNICDERMLVADGPYHLVDSDHIERLICHLSRTSLAHVNENMTTSLPAPSIQETNNDDASAQFHESSSEPESSLIVRHATPLDRFFGSFPLFRYDSSVAPSTSYKRLVKCYKWAKKSPKGKKMWELYQKALREEFHLWFGLDNDLDAWHALCRAVGIDPPPVTCKECQKAVQYRHVNLIDLIHWRRSEGETGRKRVQVFRTVRELSEYCKKTGKIFWRESRSSWIRDGVILRFLLRHIFSPEKDDHLSNQVA